MKICKVIFSTNRPDYLIRTLESFKDLNFNGHEVDGIFVDDYPQGRDDDQIRSIAEQYGYNRVVLHEKNIGLTGTWAHINQLLSDKKYDYVWQQEDDVELIAPLHVDNLIKFLEHDPLMAQVCLSRQLWYPGEIEVELSKKPGYKYEEDYTKRVEMILAALSDKEVIFAPQVNDEDKIFESYRYQTFTERFANMATLYHYWISQEPIEQTYGYHPSEGVVMACIRRNNVGYYGSIIRQHDGRPYLNHIGEYSQGIRITKQTDPGGGSFTWMDPSKRYNARWGYEVPPGQES